MTLEELERENASLKEEIDEALSLAHWCDSTNNHGRDSVVDLVKYLIHIHKVLVDDSVSQDKEVTRLRAEVERLSPEALADFVNQKKEKPMTPHRKDKAELKREIVSLRAEVERLSIDAVTGIAGRGVFDRAMVTGYARAKRSSHPMGVLMIDLDHFKRVNDDFGHQAGDRVLREVAVALGYHIRGTDVLARYGGEEFAVVVDDANPVGLAILAENMRLKVEGMNWLSYSLITVSIGWAIEESSDGEAASIMKRADAAMYAAKANGRNRVERG